MTKNVHLFVICPPASGSTLLWRLLCTSPTVSHMQDEGQYVEGAREYFGREAGSTLRAEDRWVLRPPWDAVKAVCETHWDLDKPVLIEKSAMNVPHAADMREAFPNSRFLILYRNPYAWLEGMTRRHPRSRARSTETLSRIWIRLITKQRENIEVLGSDAIHFSYEALTTDPAKVIARILDFVPELESLDSSGRFRVFERQMPIRNLNARQIRRLPRNVVARASSVWDDHRELLADLGYEVLRPGTLWDVGAAFSRGRALVDRAAGKIGRAVRS